MYINGFYYFVYCHDWQIFINFLLLLYIINIFNIYAISLQTEDHYYYFIKLLIKNQFKLRLN